MTVPEIILLVVAIVFIILSFLLVDHNKSEATENNVQDGKRVKPELSDEDIKELKSQMRTLMEETVSNSVIDADDKMSKISNEKIMAVNEFSTQLLEKIEQNNDQVVFLFNTLTQKEEEMKAMYSKMETIRRDNKEFLEKLTALMASKNKPKEPTTAASANEASLRAASAKAASGNGNGSNQKTGAGNGNGVNGKAGAGQSSLHAMTGNADSVSGMNGRAGKSGLVLDDNTSHESESHESISHVSKSNVNAKAFMETMSNSSSSKKTPADTEELVHELHEESIHTILEAAREKEEPMLQSLTDEAAVTAEIEEGNRTEEILSLYKQKKSVLEISKQLGMGQGEVKLIIDLYSHR